MSGWAEAEWVCILSGCSALARDVTSNTQGIYREYARIPGGFASGFARIREDCRIREQIRDEFATSSRELFATDTEFAKARKDSRAIPWYAGNTRDSREFARVREFWRVRWIREYARVREQVRQEIVVSSELTSEKDRRYAIKRKFADHREIRDKRTSRGNCGRLHLL